MPKRRCVTGMLIVMAVMLSAVIATSAIAAVSHASPQITWSKAANPVRSDADPSDLFAVSCPTAGACAAIDEDSDVLTSENPSAGASSWKITTLPGLGYLSTIDCTKASFCLIGDGDGNVWHSADPSGGYRQWHRVHLERPINSDGFSGMSCPTAGLCVVSDDNANIWATTKPGGGASAWHHSKVPYTGANVNGPIQCSSAKLCWVEEQEAHTRQLWETTTPLKGGWKKASGPAPQPAIKPAISCPNSGFCVKVGNSGAVATAPSSSGPWTGGQINGWSPLSGVDCVASWNCVGVDSAGNVLTSHPKTVTAKTTGVTWTAGHVPGQKSLNGVACPSAHLCLAGVKGAVLITHNPSGPASGWTKTAIPALKGATVEAISCPSTKLCTLATARGSVAASTNPAGPGTSWKLEKQLPSLSTYGGNVNQALTYAYCPSTHLCFAGTPSSAYLEGTTPGILLSSSDPGKPSSWHGVRLGFNGISCPAKNLCVAMRQPPLTGGAGAIAYSHKPTGGKKSWTIESFTRLGIGYSATASSSFSCSSAHFCVAVGSDNAHSGAGAVAVSTSPTNGKSWKVTDLTGSQLIGVTCSRSGQCVAWAEDGSLFFGIRHSN
jgi:hypothetical protein